MSTSRKRTHWYEQFFYDNAEYSYNPTTETAEQRRERCARGLATAEAYSKREGWTIEWEPEQDVDLSWCDECENGAHDRDEHANAMECAVLRDAVGHVIASLGNIDRPGDAYRRVVYAELCSEAMAQEGVSPSEEDGYHANENDLEDDALRTAQFERFSRRMGSRRTDAMQHNRGAAVKRFTMSIRCDNAAFVADTGKELARILREVADRYEQANRYHDGSYPRYQDVPALDADGHPAGTYRLADVDENGNVIWGAK